MTKEELRGQMRAMRAELTGDKRRSRAAGSRSYDGFLTSEETSPVLSICVLPYRDRYTSVIAESVERTAGNSSGSALRGGTADAVL